MDIRILYSSLILAIVYFRMYISDPSEVALYFLGYSLSQLPVGVVLEMVDPIKGIIVSSLAFFVSLFVPILLNFHHFSLTLVMGISAAYIMVQAPRLYVYSKDASGFTSVYAIGILVAAIMLIVSGLTNNSYIKAFFDIISFLSCVATVLVMFIYRKYMRELVNEKMPERKNDIVRDLKCAAFTIFDRRTFYLVGVPLFGCITIFGLANPHILVHMQKDLGMSQDISRACILMGYCAPFAAAKLAERIGFLRSQVISYIVSSTLLVALMFASKIFGYMSIKTGSFLSQMVIAFFLSVMYICDNLKGIIPFLLVRQNYEDNRMTASSIANFGAVFTVPFMGFLVFIISVMFNINTDLLSKAVLLSLALATSFISFVISMNYKRFNIKLVE